MKTTNTKNAALIADLKERIQKLIAQITPLTNERAKLERECMILSSPFATGQVIMTTQGMRIPGKSGYHPVTRYYVIERISGWGTEASCWNCRQVRKDGTAGRECKVHEWDKPTLVTAKRNCFLCAHCTILEDKPSNWIKCAAKPGTPTICSAYAEKCPKFEALT